MTSDLSEPEQPAGPAICRAFLSACLQRHSGFPLSCHVRRVLRLATEAENHLMPMATAIY